MYNMIIESEHANPVHDDLPYDWEGPLAQVDHEEPSFKLFYKIVVKFMTNMFTNNFRIM
jgi:hypothetical protein